MKAIIEIAGRVRFDLIAIVLVGVYSIMFLAAGKVEQLGYSWLMIWAVLGLFKLFSKVETGSDFLAWIRSNLRRSWRILLVYGIFLAFTLSYVIEEKSDPWTGFSGVAFSTAVALACMAWYCRSFKPPSTK